MHMKKRNPATGNGRVSLNNKSHSSELDINLHSASNGKIQAARFISKRHRISFPTAKLYCELAGIGGVL
ncbi:MAG: hypothetical protein GY761_03680 [Hyphomicrobiales bacterium]|nr:hypothetical protein [Hyphomicrobiales bacterium]